MKTLTQIDTELEEAVAALARVAEERRRILFALAESPAEGLYSKEVLLGDAPGGAAR